MIGLRDRVPDVPEDGLRPVSEDKASLLSEYSEWLAVALDRPAVLI
jgi:hypothetical protein